MLLSHISVSLSPFLCLKPMEKGPWLVWLSGLSAHQFDSQSGHMPGWQAGSPVGGVQEASNQCVSHIDVSLPLFLPPFLPPLLPL